MKLSTLLLTRTCLSQSVCGLRHQTASCVGSPDTLEVCALNITNLSLLQLPPDPTTAVRLPTVSPPISEIDASKTQPATLSEPKSVASSTTVIAVPSVTSAASWNSGTTQAPKTAGSKDLSVTQLPTPSGITFPTNSTRTGRRSCNAHRLITSYGISPSNSVSQPAVTSTSTPARKTGNHTVATPLVPVSSASFLTTLQPVLNTTRTVPALHNKTDLGRVMSTQSSEFSPTLPLAPWFLIVTYEIPYSVVSNHTKYSGVTIMTDANGLSFLISTYLSSGMFHTSNLGIIVTAPPPALTTVGSGNTTDITSTAPNPTPTNSTATTRVGTTTIVVISEPTTTSSSHISSSAYFTVTQTREITLERTVTIHIPPTTSLPLSSTPTPVLTSNPTPTVPLATSTQRPSKKRRDPKDGVECASCETSSGFRTNPSFSLMGWMSLVVLMVGGLTGLMNLE